MMNDEPHTPMRLAGRTLRQTRHVCAFFHSREDQNRVLMPFFKEGFDRGEKIFHIVDSRLRDEHLRACRAAGMDVEVALVSRQLEVRTWEDAYLKDGCFDGDRMIRVLEETFRGSREKQGLTRLMGNMEWSLEAAPGVTDILEYEAKLNHVSARYPDAIVCAYDLNRYNGTVVMDILRTHPMVIIGGVLQENPLYMPPEQFLEELRQRGTRRQGERPESAATRAS
jgi:MEDS: MEthanogen/methylotroph, DcmR Sensory domain